MCEALTAFGGGIICDQFPFVQNFNSFERYIAFKRSDLVNQI